MPNWCCGQVSVRGKPKDVEHFCRLFIFEEDVDKKTKRKYFARSFVNMKWKTFKKEYLGKGKETSFLVDFAWSGWSCLFEGYPDGKQHVTLEWACKKYKVDVEIETEEGGMGFEEFIVVKDGIATYGSKEMNTYKCNKCGNKEMIASSYELEDYECCECGKENKWELCKNG